MKIELVMTPSGLVGRRFQDRWNLAQLGIVSIPWTRNQAGIKRLRREFGEAFSFTTCHWTAQQIAITDEERFMFNRPSKRVAA